MEYFGEYTNQIIDDIEDNGVELFENSENVSDKFFSLLKERENILSSLATPDVRKRFLEILVSNGMSEGSAKVTCSNFINLKKAVTRDNAICFCFAAGMNDEQTDITLKKHLDFHGLHRRYYKDFIYAYFLRQNTGDNSVELFIRANEYIDKYSTVYDGAETQQEISSDPMWAGEMTENFEYICDEISTDEELDNYLSDKSTIAESGKTNRTATGFYYSSLSRAISNIITNMDGTGVAVRVRNDIYNSFYEEPHKLCEELIRLLNGLLNPYHAFVKNKQSRRINKKSSITKLINESDPLATYYSLYHQYLPVFEADRDAGGYGKSAKDVSDSIFDSLIQSIFNIYYFYLWGIADAGFIREGAFRDAEKTLNVVGDIKAEDVLPTRDTDDIIKLAEMQDYTNKTSLEERMNDKYYVWAKKVILNIVIILFMPKWIVSVTFWSLWHVQWQMLRIKKAFLLVQRSGRIRYLHFSDVSVLSIRKRYIR